MNITPQVKIKMLEPTTLKLISKNLMSGCISLVCVVLLNACDPELDGGMGDPRPANVSGDTLYRFEAKVENNSNVYIGQIDQVRVWADNDLVLDLTNPEEIGELMFFSTNGAVPPRNPIAPENKWVDIMYFDIRLAENQDVARFDLIVNASGGNKTFEKEFSWHVPLESTPSYEAPLQGYDSLQEGAWVANNLHSESGHRRFAYLSDLENIFYYIFGAADVDDISIKFPERYAVDFSKVKPIDPNDPNSDFCNYQNTGEHLEDHYGFGEPVFSVADGTIVLIQEGKADEEASKPEDVATNPEEVAGNMIAIVMDDGYTAFYAHLKNGSINNLGLSEGDTVIAGQKIGELGNSGNTAGGPHLHFAVLDTVDLESKSLLNANSVPFHIKEFTRLIGDHDGVRNNEFVDWVEYQTPTGCPQYDPTGNLVESLLIDFIDFPVITQ